MIESNVAGKSEGGGWGLGGGRMESAVEADAITVALMYRHKRRKFTFASGEGWRKSKK